MTRSLRFLAAAASLGLSMLGSPASAQTPEPAKGDAPPEAPAAQPAPGSAARPAAARPAAPPPAPAGASSAAPPEPELTHFRGQLTKVEASAITIKTNGGKTARVSLADAVTVIGLSKGSFTEVDFGSYVGSVAVKLDAYSPIVRDSLSWLHKGFELRVIDEALRGIAAGHKKWDLTPDSIMAHGWVDDMEDRVISIKYGPTEEEETDVEVPRDVPVLKMWLADRTLLKAGANVFIGAQKAPDGRPVAVFMLVGKDDVVPPL